MESESKSSKRCLFCGSKILVSETVCPKCGNEIFELYPKNAPGKEPEKIVGHLRSLFLELNEIYPTGEIDFSKWNHERWDKAASSLQQYLGYKNGFAFLIAYGYRMSRIPRAKVSTK